MRLVEANSLIRTAYTYRTGVIPEKQSTFSDSDAPFIRVTIGFRHCYSFAGFALHIWSFEICLLSLASGGSVKSIILLIKHNRNFDYIFDYLS